jgi:putative transposase
VRFELVHAEKANFPVTLLCKVLDVSTSGYYRWAKQRQPSPRALANERLRVEISAIHRESRGTYGSPRVHAELQQRGFEIGRNRVARLMAEQGLVGLRPRAFRRTTDSRHAKPIAPNLVEQCFDVERPNELWAADITYVWTGVGWMYLAVVLDLFSRRVVGWACAEHMRAELIVEALARALGVRDAGPGLVHHSDRGSQYASETYRSLLDERGIVCSMSAKGCCYDNAVVESFFATLKKELVYRTTWVDRETASLAISEYIQVFYNRMRLHSTLGYVSPAEYEERHQQGDAALAA